MSTTFPFGSVDSTHVYLVVAADKHSATVSISATNEPVTKLQARALAALLHEACYEIDRIEAKAKAKLT